MFFLALLTLVLLQVKYITKRLTKIGGLKFKNIDTIMMKSHKKIGFFLFTASIVHGAFTLSNFYEFVLEFLYQKKIIECYALDHSSPSICRDSVDIIYWSYCIIKMMENHLKNKKYNQKPPNQTI